MVRTCHQNGGRNMAENCSRRQPCDPRLKNGHVDVWCVSLDMEPSVLSGFHPMLSEDERRKASRFRFKNMKARYVAARGVLRSIIAAYLDARPGDLAFQYGRYGKPALAGAFSDAEITFNMSHSHGMALYAVSFGNAVGVDIEKIRSGMSFHRIAKRFLSPRESEILQRLPPDQVKNAFFTCWTRKEAYIKARGEGLSSLLSRFSVSLAPGDPPALIDHQPDPGEISRWSLTDLQIGAGYAAALAVEGHGLTVTKKKWDIAATPRDI
ncbi:MAG: hypothetical protein B5M55_04175 [Desulfococcus sp. 4484_242]|nr:MAG: hypothetical protein B5M55_04175 [Desulfococcus sp. 4484_242]